ncbi:hypothetical protein KC367_g79 [Hortaea werneckii]|nr:hypothetical protein KC367_g79 [Hortaea werneckii]
MSVESRRRKCIEVDAPTVVLSPFRKIIRSNVTKYSRLESCDRYQLYASRAVRKPGASESMRPRILQRFNGAPSIGVCCDGEGWFLDPPE